MTTHIQTKRKLKEIPRKATFTALIEESMLTDIEKNVVMMYYAEGKNMSYIADILGYSEAGIQKIHKRALKKIESIL